MLFSELYNEFKKCDARATRLGSEVDNRMVEIVKAVRDSGMEPDRYSYNNYGFDANRRKLVLKYYRESGYSSYEETVELTDGVYEDIAVLKDWLADKKKRRELAERIRLENLQREKDLAELRRLANAYPEACVHMVGPDSESIRK